nr:hypothetical protein [Streptomyces griseorubiginosus]
MEHGLRLLRQVAIRRHLRPAQRPLTGVGASAGGQTPGEGPIAANAGLPERSRSGTAARFGTLSRDSPPFPGCRQQARRVLHRYHASNCQATQIPGTACFRNRCGVATRLAG